VLIYGGELESSVVDADYFDIILDLEKLDYAQGSSSRLKE
jgi:hypothetical protein